MHWARSCATLLALTSPVEAKIGDNLRTRKFRVSYRTDLLGHLTPKRAAFSGADTSQMNLRGQGTTGKPNFFSVNAILTEICKYLTFIFRIAHLPTPLHTLLLSLIVPNRIRNPPEGRGN